jgi:hypothetical protein
MLGIYFGPTSGGGTHTREMAQKGLIWADQMTSRPLTPSFAWQSFTHQLHPGMMWGLATAILSPHNFLERFQRVCFKLLKSLGIPTPRSPHYPVLGPSLICLSPQVSLATKYLTSCEYSIEYHFRTVSLEEHQQSSTHNSREHLLAVTFLLRSLDSSLEFNHTNCCSDIFPISPAQLSPYPL